MGHACGLQLLRCGGSEQQGAHRGGSDRRCGQPECELAGCAGGGQDTPGVLCAARDERVLRRASGELHGNGHGTAGTVVQRQHAGECAGQLHGVCSGADAGGEPSRLRLGHDYAELPGGGRLGQYEHERLPTGNYGERAPQLLDQVPTGLLSELRGSTCARHQLREHRL